MEHVIRALLEAADQEEVDQKWLLKQASDGLSKLQKRLEQGGLTGDEGTALQEEIATASDLKKELTFKAGRWRDYEPIRDGAYCCPICHFELGGAYVNMTSVAHTKSDKFDLLQCFKGHQVKAAKEDCA